MVAYRAAYGDWRRGKAKGAHGEPDSIGKVKVKVAGMGQNLPADLPADKKKGFA